MIFRIHLIDCKDDPYVPQKPRFTKLIVCESLWCILAQYQKPKGRSYVSTGLLVKLQIEKQRQRSALKFKKANDRVFIIIENKDKC